MTEDASWKLKLYIAAVAAIPLAVLIGRILFGVIVEGWGWAMFSY